MKRPKIIPIDKVKAKQKKIIDWLCKQLMEQGIIIKREALSSGKGWRAKSGRVLIANTNSNNLSFHPVDLNHSGSNKQGPSSKSEQSRTFLSNTEQAYFYLDSKIPLGEQIVMLKELLQESNRDVGNLSTGNL